MDPVQVALLTLAALVVGMLFPVMLQVWLTLRQVQQELRNTHTKIDPLLDEMRAVVSQVRNTTHVASAVALAVTAGVQAWRESRHGSNDAGKDSP
jgi:hypothetical protein